MPAIIKSFKFEGNELVVEMELRIAFGIGQEMPMAAKEQKTGNYIDAKREAKRKYQKDWLAKKKIAKGDSSGASDEKLERMQKLQDKIKKLQQE